MVPVAPGQTLTSLTRNGSPVAFVLGTVKGMQYAFFPALAGAYQVTLAGDTTPPAVTSVIPGNNAIGVGVGTTVRLTFNEAMDPATINSSTITLLNPSSIPVPATVSYDPATNTATLTPNNALAFSATYTVSVLRQAGGVTDLAGNALVANFTSFFTTAAAPTCPCTLWPNTATPGNPSDPEGAALELGVKFRASVSGFLTGIRFYKGTLNTGTHVGSLWTQHRDAPRAGHLHQRDGVRLAAGDLRHAGGHHGEYHLRRLLPHQCGPLRGRQRLLRRRRPHDWPPHRPPRWRRRRQRGLPGRRD